MNTEKKRSWIKRHKVLTVILVFIALGAVGAATGDNKTTGTSNTGAKQTSQQEKTPELDLTKFYNEVKNGMTKDQVIEVAGGVQPSNCSQSAVQGLGESEFCSWSSFSNSVSVDFNNGAVSSKAKIGF